MASAIFPDMADSQPYNQSHVNMILDEIIHTGNRVAESRKAELNFLRLAFQEFSMRIQQQDLQTLSWTDTLLDSRGEPGLMPRQEQQCQTPQVISQVTGTSVGLLPAMAPQMVQDYLQPPETVEFLENIGISSGEFLNIVDQMGSQDYNMFGGFGSSM